MIVNQEQGDYPRQYGDRSLDERPQMGFQPTNVVGPNIGALPKTAGGSLPRRSQCSALFTVTYA